MCVRTQRKCLCGLGIVSMRQHCLWTEMNVWGFGGSLAQINQIAEAAQTLSRHSDSAEADMVFQRDSYGCSSFVVLVCAVSTWSVVIHAESRVARRPQRMSSLYLLSIICC